MCAKTALAKGQIKLTTWDGVAKKGKKSLAKVFRLSSTNMKEDPAKRL